MSKIRGFEKVSAYAGVDLTMPVRKTEYSCGYDIAAAEDMPGGFDREVGENGGHLSGGQRQRVALARAIAADAEILILQDPTTAVDSVTEQTIAERVAAARADKPTIVYTNAPAWQAVEVGAK